MSRIHLFLTNELIVNKYSIRNIRWGLNPGSPHEVGVSGGGRPGAQRPHVFASVAQLHTRGQLTGQEAQGEEAEDPEEETG